MTDKPIPKTGLAQKELDKVEKQFEEFDNQVKSLTQDRMNAAPRLETEQQTQLSSNQIQKSKDFYLKPSRTLSSKEKFNETFRGEYEYAKELVQFIAENKEIVGEGIELWTKPFPGISCEFWQVPCNKPVWGPRYLAEQIKRKYYHRLKMENTIVESGTMGSIYGNMAVDTTVARLDAHPVSQRKSIFMGNSGTF